MEIDIRKMKVENVMTKNVYTLKKEDTVSKAILLMVEKRFHQIPIVNESYEGMIFLKDLIKFRGDPTKTRVENFIKKSPELRGKMDISEAIKMLVSSGLRALPVIENGRLVGILSESDVIFRVEMKEFREIEAKEVMSKVITASENEKLRTILRIMEKNNISSVPLINWKEEISGCINLFSVAKFLYQKKERIESLRSAKEKKNILNNPAKIFSFFPNVASVNEKLNEVIKLLQNGEEVVITEKNKPIGIVKARDVLELLVSEEKIPIVISGVEDGKEILEFFEKVAEKWKKFGVQKIAIQIEKVGVREKYFGRIKVYIKEKVLIAKSQAFDIASVVRSLREKVEREIIKEREIRWDKRKEMIKLKGV